MVGQVSDILVLVFLIWLRIAGSLILFRGLINMAGRGLVLQLSLILAVFFCLSLDLPSFDGISEQPVTVIVLLALREALLGLLFGLPVFLLSEMPVQAARLVEAARGLLFSEQHMAELGSRGCVLETAALLCFLAIAFIGNGYRLVAGLFARTLNSEGVGVAQLQWRVAESGGAEPILFLANEAITQAFCLAAPVIICCLVLDIGIGFIARAIPKLNLFFELLPLKVVVGLGLLLFAFPYWTDSGKSLALEVARIQGYLFGFDLP